MVQRFGRTPSLLCCWKDNESTINEDEKKHPTTTIHELDSNPIPAAMNSPLPDASALEAGILEDERPSRLSRVQDNVRNLLRTSVFGGVSIKSSPTTPTHPRQAPDFANETPSPLPHVAREQPEVLPSPTSTTSSTHYTSSPREAAFITSQNDFATSQHPTARPQHTAHQSTLFNTRAVAALNHPDLSDPSLATFSQQKMQRRCRSRGGWTRSSPSRKGRKKAATAVAGSRVVLCLLATLLLAALVATYITIATTTAGLTTTFHVLFVLGICLATIVFAYSIIQLFVVGKRAKKQPLFIAVSRHGGHQRRHRHHHHNHSQRSLQQRAMPTLTGENDFVPTMPIPVHLSSDDLPIRADPLPAHPTAGAEMASQSWDKDAQELPNPPPAYGRWRNSVRANPDLLHWQPVPSPLTPALPSPTYEEALAEGRNVNESPPSYMTRESPARQREIREARAGIARSQVVEPEMVEARGAGVGLAM